MKTTTMNQLFSNIQAGLKADEIILDVREPDEFKNGHLPGSKNIPLSTLEKEVNLIRNFSKVFIHCQAGGRAQKAAQFLKSQGLTNLVCVADGGYGDWAAAGYPVER